MYGPYRLTGCDVCECCRLTGVARNTDATPAMLLMFRAHLYALYGECHIKVKIHTWTGGSPLRISLSLDPHHQWLGCVLTCVEENWGLGWHNGRAFDHQAEGPGFEPRWGGRTIMGLRIEMPVGLINSLNTRQ